jgi:phosphonate transport system ATP-binding protein
MINLAKPMRKEIDSMMPIVSRLGLEEKLHAPVEQLSGGQQQRTAICRALHQGANIFIGDEPVSSVDKRQAEIVLESICESYSTVLIAMHDIRLALDYTDRVLGVMNGKLIVDERTSKLQPPDLDFLFHDE